LSSAAARGKNRVDVLLQFIQDSLQIGLSVPMPLWMPSVRPSIEGRHLRRELLVGGNTVAKKTVAKKAAKKVAKKTAKKAGCKC